MTAFRSVISVLILVLALAAGAPPLRAEEAIERFVSELTVEKDAGVSVTETITVRAEGLQIKRGILRDFPTSYRTPGGKPYRVGFTVSGVTRDGLDENWSTESIANGVRIRIGRADVMLEEGPHTYQIRYRATGELGFFDGYDEIYWNVTGNSWTLPILAAQSIVHLPEGAAVLQHAAYTGAEGAQGGDFRVETAAGALYRAETARRLEPGEGFTVAVGFTPGVVTRPLPPADTTMLSYEVLGGGVGLLALYYLAAWVLFGRDPSAGPVVPLWWPPKGLGPAGVRYIHARVFDEKSFAAALIGLAAKGRIAIRHDKDYVITKLGGGEAGLEPAEQALYGGLPKTLAVKKGGATLGPLWESLRGAITAQYGRSTRVTNSSWFWGGIALSAAVIVSALIFADTESYVGAFLAVYLGGAIWGLVLWLSVIGVRAIRRTHGISLLVFVIVVPLVVMGIAFPAAFVAGAKGAAIWIYAAGMAAMGGMHVLFARLLPAPTVLGAKLEREVEGLRLYMTVAEEKRLDLLNPPEETPELFERLLPYAIALGCENQWSERFADVLASAHYAGPAWYQGASLLDDVGDFGRTLDSNRYTPSTSSGSSFSTSSSSWSPGSSSGSSGGGSSGGGGGGGGGSGW